MTKITTDSYSAFFSMDTFKLVLQAVSRGSNFRNFTALCFLYFEDQTIQPRVD